MTKLANNKLDQHEISDENTVQIKTIEIDDLKQDESKMSDKENYYFEDSDDSVKDPNFETGYGNESSNSDSSADRPTSRKRVRRVSQLLLKQKQQTQPYVNTDTPGQSVCTTSTFPISKNIPQHNLSTSSDSSSSTSSSNSSSSSSNSTVSSKSSLSKNRCSSNEIVPASPPCKQENNVVENEVPQLSKSPVRKSCKNRKCCVNEWLSNKAKTLINTGESYTSRSKSRKIVPKWSLKPP
ncbi:unnamed protein product, partial [Brenthis ino]